MDQTRPYSEHRQKRRELWASLWLARVVRLLTVFANLPMPDAWCRWFDQVLGLLTKAVVYLVLIRAAQLKAPPALGRNPRQVALTMKRHDVRVTEQTSWRPVIGGRLRRAVKAGGFQAKDFQARAEKLLCVLKSLDVWAARIAHRARNGMTRLESAHTCATETLPLHLPSLTLWRDEPSNQAMPGAALRTALAPP